MQTAPCPVCPGEGQELGSLGKTTHYRCRDCGWTFHDSDIQTVERFADDDDPEQDEYVISGLRDVDVDHPLHLEL